GRLAILPGTFDPVTHGHQDLMVRALRLFDRLVVAVALREEKGVLFPHRERVEMVRRVTRGMRGVKVLPFQGLLVDLAEQLRATAVVRGLRAVSDFEFEFQMALMNRRLRPQLEIVFLMPSARYTFVNSSVIKEIARNGGSVRGLVAPEVARRLKARFAAERPRGGRE
ncbi:MAG TPA: pantetheine-phosphate adenylyltransferase, partial [Candidatus Saccharimonadales bacterium]|nr:pantetheine-phosphate adenylyltransferase [Candidatus Saccharimonadales bacterium]